MARLGEYEAAGVERVFLQHLLFRDEEILELFAAEVVPALVSVPAASPPRSPGRGSTAPATAGGATTTGSPAWRRIPARGPCTRAPTASSWTATGSPCSASAAAGSRCCSG